MILESKLFLLYEDLFECYPEDMVYYKSSPYRGFRIIGDLKRIIYARSLWEANVAHYLEWLRSKGEIISWHHEPKTFYFDWIKRGCNNYTPDFLVQDKTLKEYWIEVKGFMDSRSATKIKRFKKLCPEDQILIFDQKWFKRNEPKLKYIVPEWETQKNLRIYKKEEIEHLRSGKEHFSLLMIK
jgi:hypothetical protein